MNKTSPPPPLASRRNPLGSLAVEGPGSHGARVGLMVEAREGQEDIKDASNEVKGFSAKLNGWRPNVVGTHHRKMMFSVSNDIN